MRPGMGGMNGGMGNMGGMNAMRMGMAPPPQGMYGYQQVQPMMMDVGAYGGGGAYGGAPGGPGMERMGMIRGRPN